MEKQSFNLNNRILMFSVCSSIEYDLRDFILHNRPIIPLPNALVEKALSRNKGSENVTLDIQENGNSNNFNILVELDLGELYTLIMSHNIEFKINIQRKNKFQKIFEKIIPIRNRVMHSRPLEFADRSILEEALTTIDVELPTINWKELIKTRKLILESPQTILLEQHLSLKDDSTNIFHNLPLPEFDDTGFVGRSTEINDITELILNNKSQIVTIIGNGGIGKTATTIKCLYDIIDSPRGQDRFDAMIWVSLKTRSLTSGEFLNIKNAIESLDSMYTFLQDNMVNESASPTDDIISFMKEFKTLLIIDNLETITTEEIINFLKDIPENSKVLITSRSGLGELETRYNLPAMNLNDSRNYFRLLSQYYGLEIYKRDKDDLNQLIKNDLYSSPLSIKWFVTSIFFGSDEKTLIANKEELITFSMSNIVERLTNSQREILHLFLLQGRPLVFGEIDFYLNSTTNDIVTNISVLLSTSMLELKGSSYQINSMAKDYLSIHNSPSNEFTKAISKRRSDLNHILQEIKIKKEANPFLPQSLFGNMDSENKKIASYYLIQALENSAEKNWTEAYTLIDRARDVAPEYFEVYKIKAFINAEKLNLYEAIDSYRTALENADTGFQKATVYFLFAVFYRRKMDDYEEANRMIDNAIDNFPNSNEIILEKVRILIFLAQYDEAEEFLLQIAPTESDTDKFKNKYASRYADLCIRKSQQYGRRDFEKSFNLIVKAINIIEDLQEIDKGTSAVLIKALADLSFLTYDNQAKILLEEKIALHFSSIVNNTNNVIRKLINSILNRKEMYSDETIKLVSRLGINFYHECKQISVHNEGYIINLKSNYGFVANKFDSLFFSINDISYENPLVGDTVNFELEKNPRGNKAKNLKKSVEK